MELLNDTFVFMISFIRGFIGVILIIRARKTKLTNYYALAITIFFECIGYLFYTSILNNLFIFYVFMAAMWVPLIIFIDKTFYQEKKSPFKFFLLLTIILAIIKIVAVAIYQFGPIQDFNALFLARISLSIALGSTALWLNSASYTSYIKIKSDEGVEPWIKTRYLLVCFYTFAQIGIAITWPFFPYDKSINIWYILGALSLVLFIFAQFLAWVMPAGFKKWLNRNYKPGEKEEDLSEDEIMKSFKEE